MAGARWWGRNGAPTWGNGRPGTALYALGSLGGGRSWPSIAGRFGWRRSYFWLGRRGQASKINRPTEDKPCCPKYSSCPVAAFGVGNVSHATARHARGRDETSLLWCSVLTHQAPPPAQAQQPSNPPLVPSMYAGANTSPTTRTQISGATISAGQFLSVPVK